MVREMELEAAPRAQEPSIHDNLNFLVGVAVAKAPIESRCTK
jgi:hypothetical protein